MKLWNNIGAYAKGIVAVATAVITSLAPVYGTQYWYAAMTAGLGALAVILIPNAAAKAPAAPPPQEPVKTQP